MTKEQLRMQMLAGIITESQYKAKLEEEDVMGKIGKSYPAPGSTEVTLTPQQKKVWEDAMIERFKEMVVDEEEGDVEEAIYDIPYATKDILANILTGRKPDELWERNSERENALKGKGISIDEFESYADDIEREFERGATNNPEIKNIQSWIKAWFD